jgi:spermidine synthase
LREADPAFRSLQAFGFFCVHWADPTVIYLLFFLSGLSGLIYQVVWVRMFGNVFGNTIYSASIVVAVFMLGLGAGSYLIGVWADRRYARMTEGRTHPNALLRAYGHFELAIAAMGLAIALVLPHLGALSAMVSSYTREPSGWYALSAASYLARAAIAVGLLTPITLLMGGTLTLLIRHLVRRELELGGWRIALLYGINTAGAAAGAALTDFILVPSLGLFGTQGLAVLANVVAGAGALMLASARTVRLKADTTTKKKGKRQQRDADDVRSVRLQTDRADGRIVRLQADPALALTGLALGMSGLAALGMEILWFRHFSMLLGGFRAVFSLLLTLILAGIGLGALAGGAIDRRTRRPAEWFVLVQALFVASTLAGLALADVDAINAPDPGAPAIPVSDAAAGPFEEIWFNAGPMLIELAVPALLMGFSFPLANAIVQRAEQSVGRRAGVLYLANTAGAVAGSLTAGFVLLPALGLQGSATILMIVAALAVVPLYAAARPALPAVAASLVIAGAALGLWLQLPSDYITARALGTPDAGERRIVVNDGLTELIAVTETPGKGRTLVTNGHAMSSTWPLAQRYMRALAHIPLLSMDQPEDVLVIGFGVGNTTHAATLHPSVRSVELADLSRDILAHARYFNDGNKGVLDDPRVAVHINDGRQHLQMQPPGVYDLIVLEPPPIAYAGVGALYSREFYELARTRLQPGGYISQWLPTYQVPPLTAIAMVRAFVDVFPQSVLLSGAGSDLILLGTSAARIEIDPARVAAALAPAVRADLEQVDLGALHEIVGTFVGSARRLAEATRSVAPVVDDRPMQEYGVRSMLNYGHGVPGAIVALDEVAEWCPRCFMGDRPAALVEQLDEYLELLNLAYAASSIEMAAAVRLSETERRTVAGSRYLGAIVPESAELHNVLGLALAESGQLDAAIREFRRSLELSSDNGLTHWHLGAALASRGAHAEATVHLARAVELDPGNSRAHSDLGLTLAMQGRLDEAAAHLERAIALDPQAEDARRNLAVVQQRRGRGGAQP